MQYVTIEEKHRHASANEKDLRQTLTELRHSYQRLDMELVQGQLQRNALERKIAELEEDRKALGELRPRHAKLQEEVERLRDRTKRDQLMLQAFRRHSTFVGGRQDIAHLVVARDKPAK